MTLGSRATRATDLELSDAAGCRLRAAVSFRDVLPSSVASRGTVLAHGGCREATPITAMVPLRARL